MRLQDIVSEKEVDAVERMIDAHLEVQSAKEAFWRAEMILNDKIKELTNACFPKGQGSTRTLPETFVIERNDMVFVVTLDVDDWTHHRIERVGGLIA